ncbi:MAG: GNAT family N-acetyltransferase [Bauldia sp.]
MTYSVRRPTSGRAEIAERILKTLPQWFGRPEATASYVEAAGRLPMIAAANGNAVIGFMTLIRRSPDACEIAVMAVEPAHRRRGVGRLLVSEAVADCRAEGIRTLLVQTLGPSHPDRHYAETRAFYRRPALPRGSRRRMRGDSR